MAWDAPGEKQMCDESQRESSNDRPLPPTVEVFHADCRFALHRATSVKTLLEMLGHRPRAFVVNIERLTAMDARGVRIIQVLAERCRHTGTTLIIGGAGDQARAMLGRAGLLDELGPHTVFPSLREALGYAGTRARR